MERELVIRAQQGDVDAFTILVREAADRLKGVAYRILRDADRADDATQRALIAAWEHLGDLRDPDRWVGWTYRLVVNAAYREARRDRSRHARVRLIRPDAASEPDASNEVAERDALDRAFRLLSPDQRAVIVLHHYAGLSQAEIAEILGIPSGTVGSRIHHAVRRLRTALEAESGRTLAPERVA